MNESQLRHIQTEYEIKNLEQEVEILKSKVNALESLIDARYNTILESFAVLCIVILLSFLIAI